MYRNCRQYKYSNIIIINKEWSNIPFYYTWTIHENET